MTADVFLDEAGYTGPDLINPEQPVFILASTTIEAEEARSLLKSCFDNQQSEVKYSKRVKSERGRRQILDFLSILKVDRRNVVFFSFHKQFLLLTNLIDFWLEPMMFEDGVNLYENGGNIALANVSYLTLGTCLGLDGRRELLRRFQVMTRDRTRFAFDSFWRSLVGAIKQHELIENVLGGLLVAPYRLGYKHLIQLPAHMLDPGDIRLIDTVQHWRKQVPGADLMLFHDQSTMLESQREFWEAILDPANPAAEVGQDRRTIVFPLPVRALRFEDSRQFPQLQVADIIAGAARSVLNGRVNGRSDPYYDAIKERGLLNGLGGGVWPTDLVTPADLGTEGPVLADTAEFVNSLVRSHKNKFA